MSDLISRQSVIDTIHNYWAKRLETLPTRMTEDGEVYSDIKSMDKILEHNKIQIGMIKQLPSAEPTIEERKVGKWIDGFCSECGEEAVTEWNDCGGELLLTRFCPNCGAKMEVKE